jgi:prepilin-type N-terminal cleavage/methylation domain-containing protein
MKHPSASPEQSAFTLIELLVVIAIIAILAGLGLAAMSGALQSGKKAQARNDVNQLASAIKAYQLEYAKLPGSVSGADTLNTADTIATVIGNLTSTNGNPRGIVFYEAKLVKDPAAPRSGLSTDGKLYDPWGMPYQVDLDTDYNNVITNTTATGTATKYFTTAVVVSSGPDTNMSPKAMAADNISNVR